MSRIFPPTLSRYLARVYAVNFLILLFGLLAIVYLFDTVELLRRASKFDDVPLPLVLQMGLLKLPEVGQMTLPFAVLFSAMMTFWQLTRKHELVIVRAAGLSVWQFLGPVVGVALLIGVLQITVINPLGAMLLGRFDVLESRHLNRQENLVSLSEQGLWLRQGEEQDGEVILHARRVQMPEWVLKDVMALFFDANNDFARRIDAREATLKNGEWTFLHAVVNQPGDIHPRQADYISLATPLTVGEIEESFASANTIPFWRLGAFIKTMESTGFDATALKIQMQGLLSRPLMFAAMILLAASVSLRPPRLRGTGTLVVAGVVIGFIVFFLSSFLQALGASGQLPPLISAWVAPAICLLLGLLAMMTLEDG
jgi:lipopolysaccharide export system permease protein